MVQEVKALRMCMEHFRRQLSRLATQVGKMQQESYRTKNLLVDTVDVVEGLASVESNSGSRSKSNPNPKQRPPWDSSPIPSLLQAKRPSSWTATNHAALSSVLQKAKIRQKQGRVIMS